MATLTDPIPNSFQKFNNMTYGISLYLQSPENYARMMDTGTKDVTGMELLIQSGGISTDPGEAGDATLGPAQPASGNFGAVRNKFFTRDFYLDDIQLQSYIAGTSTGGPQNSFEVKFTVTEPMGLTFMERLYNASTDYARRIGFENFNPINQLYLMVIRFYGYDEFGNQILNGAFNDSSDPGSYIEKWIPLMISQVRFRVESSKVVYACECVCPQTQIGQGQVHGTIPFNMGLQGNTLQDLLGEDSRNLQGGKSYGLMDALNEQQTRLASAKKYDLADKYHIEFEGGASGKLATSFINPNETPILARSMFTKPTDTSISAKVLAGQTQATNAGMKIVKFIDLAVRSSSYMSSQYKRINDANKDKSSKPTAKNDNELFWFKIRPRIKILGFDAARQSWAYDITYVVSEYQVKTVNTDDFTTVDCFKTHKEYDYWFTGKNTEVLDFSQDFNSFYFTTFSAKNNQDPEQAPTRQTNLRAQKVYRANSTEAQTGENLADEQAANAASVLYAPQDIAQVEIDIVGDPDWLGQSELFYAATVAGPGDEILDDGSINYDRTEVFFSVNFNTVVDYSLDTGLADVTQQNVTENLDGSISGSVSQYAFVYRANTIISQFEKGKFTQKLSGTLVFIPETCITGQPEEPRA